MQKNHDIKQDSSSLKLMMWRREILKKILKVLLIGGAVALLPSLWGSYITGEWVILIADAVTFAGIIYLHFSQTLEYPLRALFFILIIILLSLLLLVQVGVLGAGILWLNAALIFSVLLNGRRFTLITGIILLVFLGIIGIIMSKNLLTWSIPPVIWIIQMANFAGAAIGTGLAVSFVINGLDASLLEQEDLSGRLEENNSKLKQMNRELSRLSLHRAELLDELNHRVRNNMQLIASLLNLVRETEGERAAKKEPQTDELSRRYEAWVWALALVHDETAGSQIITDLSAEILLKQLCMHQFPMTHSPGVSVRWRTVAEGITISVQAAGPFSLLVTELIEMLIFLNNREVASGTVCQSIEINCSYGMSGTGVLRLDPFFNTQLQRQEMSQRTLILEALTAQIGGQLVLCCQSEVLHADIRLNPGEGLPEGE